MSDHLPAETGVKRYTVWFQINSSAYVEVEANNEEEAREKAENAMSEPGLCHQCSKDLQVDSVGEIVSVEVYDNE